ncbi:response regulator transcription factor [Cryobacterium sp. TMT4-31]|uniref:response regulator transcription factor n=1 Tax=Cryobacterium sp. TMT4-31 TaxID=1259259 RepID=UPI0010693BC5|nr:response regulator transcription factor [Cryobacterium sp. TMT4-31]TFC90867.1 response regulator transcription factor [Cryobacterium sp. TMT4-31]
MTAPARPIRVVLVDDQLLLRRSLAQVINTAAGLLVVGEAGDGFEAVDVAEATLPDVILMDVRMPRLDGIEATRRICSNPALRGARVLMLSMFELDEYVFDALRAGASGFVLKDSKPGDLIDAIVRTSTGEALFAPSVLTRLVAHYLNRAPEAAGAAAKRGAAAALTDREVEVLGLIGRGLSNDQLAVHLTISVKTVKSHISHLLSKLAARDRAQLVIAAYDNGLVLPRRL